MNDEIFERVKAVLVDQLNYGSEIKPEARIQEDLGADSLDGVFIVMALEDEFNIEILDTELDSVKTVEDVVHYIEGKL